MPEAYGGPGMDMTTTCLLKEEVAKVSASCASILSNNTISVVAPLLHFGNEEQRQRWLPDIVKHHCLSAIAITEPHAGSDVAAMRTRAVKKGGDYILNGQKCFITLVALAKYILVFGKPIAEFQGLQFMLADMSIQIDAARALLYDVTTRIDAGELDDDVPQLASSVKCFASDVVMKVSTDAVQMLGGHGYIRDNHVERMMRDAKILQIYEGTNQIQRMIIARRASFAFRSGSPGSLMA